MDADERGKGYLSSLITDRPWTRAGERQVVYLTALLGGQLSGILAGALICDPDYGIPGLTGDADFWDTVACGAWLGSAAGIACGIAMGSSRNLGARLLLAAMAGTALVTLVLGLIFGGYAPGRWEGDGLRRGLTLLERPIGWGLYLGSGWSATAALVIHLARRCHGKPRLMLGATLLAILVGARSQSFFWSDWKFLNGPTASCSGYSVEYPAAPSGVVCALTLLTTAIFCGMAAVRFHPKKLALYLGSVTAAIALFLAWAAREMPFTTGSPITEMTFSDDDREVITVHEGNTVRLWECGKDRAPIEAGRWRFAKPASWHEQVVARYPFAACLGNHGIQIWTLPEMRRAGFIQLEGEGWEGLSFSPDGCILAAARPGEVRPFSLTLDESTSRVDVSPGVPVTPDLASFPGPLRWFSISDAGVVRFHDPRRRFVTLRENGWAGGIQILATLRDDTSILGQLYRKKTYVWNAGRPGTQMVFSPAITDLLTSIVSRNDRYLLLMCGMDRWVLDVERGEILRHELSADPPPKLIQSSPNDRWIVAVRDSHIETWSWPSAGASR